MITKLIGWSVKNKLLVVLLTALLIVAGVWAAIHSSIDAVPDLSDVQVIVITDYAGQAPQVVEDQVTYPLTTALMGIPHAKAVRGQSMFETSMIYVIFDEGTDLYWARKPCAGISELRKDPSAQRHRTEARPGRDRRWMGLSVCPLSWLLLAGPSTRVVA